MRLHSTYHADCLCGHPIESATRVTTCPLCERVLVFEWGGEPVLGDPPAAKEDEAEKPKAKGGNAKGACA
jgi:hypothetical protein